MYIQECKSLLQKLGQKGYWALYYATKICIHDVLRKNLKYFNNEKIIYQDNGLMKQAGAELGQALIELLFSLA